MVPESFGTKKCTTGWNCFQRGPERLWREAFNVKSKLQWRPQDAGDANTIEHLMRIAVGMEWNQPEGERLYVLQNWTRERYLILWEHR